MTPLFHAEPGSSIVLQVGLEDVSVYRFEELDFFVHGGLHDGCGVVQTVRFFFARPQPRSV